MQPLLIIVHIRSSSQPEPLLISIIRSGSRTVADNLGLSVVCHLQHFKNRK
jgi:hypothetical protein